MLILNTLLFLHSAFMLFMVKMLVKGEVEGSALNRHGNYIVDHGKSWKDHAVVFLKFLWEPWTSYIPYLTEKFVICVF